MTKEELMAEAKLLDGCELVDDENDIEQLMSIACTEIRKLEQQVAYWKLSFHKQCESSRK